MSSIKYRPEIDGLRALAVIPVILFHFSAELLPGGFLGVDVFFVISGFLITSLILDEHGRGEFRLANFWLRRVRRILPALIPMVLATLIAGSVVLYSPDLKNLGGQGIGALLSFSNISHWLIAKSYWGHAAQDSPLLHTWSLSVEEQFYLLFPLLLVGLLKYLPGAIGRAFLVLSLLSFSLFLYAAQAHPVATFYLVVTRAWELGAGVLLAVFVQARGSASAEVVARQSALALLGVLLVFASYLLFDGQDGLSVFLFVPVVGATLIIACAGNPHGIVNRALSVSPLVYIGRISYSLYLWHWPVLVLSRQSPWEAVSSASPLVLIGVILAISVLSYHLIEVPTRKNEKAAPWILFVLFLAVVASAYLKYGVEAEDLSAYSPTQWHGYEYSVNPKPVDPEEIRSRMQGIAVTQRADRDAMLYLSGGVQKLYGAEQPEIVVLGDSHALMWGRVLDEVARELAVSIAFYAAVATPPFIALPPARAPQGERYFSADEKLAFDRARLKFLETWRPKLVVIVARWSQIEKDETTDFMRYLGRMGVQVLLIEQPPELFFENKNAPQYLSFLGKTPLPGVMQSVRGLPGAEYSSGIELVRNLAVDHAFCERVPVADLFIAGGEVRVLDGADVLYVDDDHLSYAGALRAKARIFDAVKKRLNNPD